MPDGPFAVEQTETLTAGAVIEALGYRPDVFVATLRGIPQEIELRSNGHRPYLVCPGCAKPKGRLYLPPGGRRLACRVCHGLRYLQQLVSRNDELRRCMELRRKELSGVAVNIGEALGACAALSSAGDLPGWGAELREAVRARSKNERAQRPDLEQARDALELCATVDQLLGREDHLLLADLSRIRAEVEGQGPG